MVASYVRVDDLRVYPGDDRAFTWPVLNDEGAPMSLVGWSARAQVRPMLGGGVLHEWSTEDGSIVLQSAAEGPGGVVIPSSLTLKVDDSESWTWRHGRFDIHLTDPNGRTQVLARGSVVVDRGVTGVSHG
jgi:hypothetical protein